MTPISSQIHEFFVTQTNFSPIVVSKVLVKSIVSTVANGRYTHSDSFDIFHKLATNPDGWSRCSRGLQHPKMHFQTPHDHAG